MFEEKDYTTITISSAKKIKTYILSKALTNFFKYLFIALVAIFIIAFIFIKYLSVEVFSLSKTNQDLSTNYKNMIEKNNNLAAAVTNKEQELLELNGKIENVEKIIGIRAYDENTSYNKRVDIAKLSLVEKQYTLHSIPSGKPLKYITINSRYGWRVHPVTKKRSFHTGVDLKANMRTRVYSTCNGVVTYAGYNQRGYGYMIIISHAYGFTTLYAHLSQIRVKIGDVVSEGDNIALTGSSGLSSGPHLHYEIRYAQRSLSPMNFIRWNMNNYEQIFKKEKKVKWHSLISLIKKELTMFQ